MHILFVCRYNRFRSRIAEAYFDKIKKNKNIKTKSAGLIEGDLIGEIAKKVAHELMLDISGKPRGLSSKLLEWADKIIVVADDVPKSVFDDNKESLRKTTILKIRDAKIDNYNNIKRVAKDVIKAIDKFEKNLKF